MSGKLSGRQEENALCAVQWRVPSLFSLQWKLYLIGIPVVKEILLLLDSEAKY